MDQQNQNLFELQLDQPSTAYLGEAAKWAKFLAIIGFIFCALFIVFAFFAGAIMSATMGAATGNGMSSLFGSGIITIFYLALAALYLFPCIFLFRFSTQMQDAIRNHEQAKLQGSFKNLKSCFRFVGILTIIFIALYILAIIGFLVVGVGAIMQ